MASNESSDDESDRGKRRETLEKVDTILMKDVKITNTSTPVEKKEAWPVDNDKTNQRRPVSGPDERGRQQAYNDQTARSTIRSKERSITRKTDALKPPPSKEELAQIRSRTREQDAARREQSRNSGRNSSRNRTTSRDSSESREASPEPIQQAASQTRDLQENQPNKPDDIDLNHLQTILPAYLERRKRKGQGSEKEEQIESSATVKQDEGKNTSVADIPAPQESSNKRNSRTLWSNASKVVKNGITLSKRTNQQPTDNTSGDFTNLQTADVPVELESDDSSHGEHDPSNRRLLYQAGKKIGGEGEFDDNTLILENDSNLLDEQHSPSTVTDSDTTRASTAGSGQFTGYRQATSTPNSHHELRPNRHLNDTYNHQKKITLVPLSQKNPRVQEQEDTKGESWNEWFSTNFSWLSRETPFEENNDAVAPEFDTYGESSFGFCCIYVSMSFIVGMLCIVGLVAWLDVNVQGIDKGVIVRKNYINLQCMQDPTLCKPMNKTHQCIHAFAVGHDPESISVQTPLLPIIMMTKNDILRNMRDTTYTEGRSTQYTVHDLSVQNDNLQSIYRGFPNTQYGVIAYGQTQNFCPTVSVNGKAETCVSWSDRVEQLQTNNNNSWIAFKKDNSGCKQYDNIYATNSHYAQVVCKMMRTPRMAMTHIQNDMYNLFSAQNEMSLVVCWNAVVLVFSFVVFVYVTLDYRKQQKQKAQTMNNVPWPFLDGSAQFVVTVAALLVLGTTLSMMTQRNATNSSEYKDSLLPTGSIMITVISGGFSCLLVLCSPFYVQGYVRPDKPIQLPGVQERIYTNITWERYARFLLSRNDLCIAYCNFLTFPILVLIIYVRYNWYSIDVHIQRAFFSAVAVGVFNITEVSVMGLMSLITEIDELHSRRKFLLKYEDGKSAHIRFNHSNLINFTAQLVFFLSKMAVFIPTVSQIRRDTKWLHGEVNEQFKGQKNATQPLIDVTLAFFAINQTLPLLQNMVVNMGLSTNMLTWIRRMDAKLFTFTLMNLAVVLILNFTTQ